jgi:hypothetical protein
LGGTTLPTRIIVYTYCAIVFPCKVLLMRSAIIAA